MEEKSEAGKLLSANHVMGLFGLKDAPETKTVSTSEIVGAPDQMSNEVTVEGFPLACAGGPAVDTCGVGEMSFTTMFAEVPDKGREEIPSSGELYRKAMDESKSSGKPWECKISRDEEEE